ncbi:phage shock protein PspA [Alteromonadaceae bacterium M269]|nr:phage shock protein PspA [Alteromonadaceae bacterium M269]
MSMFSRISDIVQSNLNAMLDKAEDPQKVVRLIIQEMQETLVELRSVAARNLAEKKDYQRRIDAAQRKESDWQNKAELALSKDREDLARSALIEKQQITEQLAVLTQQMTVLDENLEKLQDDATRLQEKLAEAKAKQKSMAMRQKTADVRLKVKAKQATVEIDEVITRFESYQNKLDDLEAQVEAYDIVNSEKSLEKEFRDLEKDGVIEAELEALKKKVA